jgi:hypothetical protein
VVRVALIVGFSLSIWVVEEPYCAHFVSYGYDWLTYHFGDLDDLVVGIVPVVYSFQLTEGTEAFAKPLQLSYVLFLKDLSSRYFKLKGLT